MPKLAARRGRELATATFSRCRRYRFVLTRTWKSKAPVVCWIMLNPSAADQHTLDPTLRRCVAFSRAWGFGGLAVVNLFALRTPYPAELLQAADPVGQRNDGYIRTWSQRSDQVVVAWGVSGRWLGRDEEVLRNLARMGVPLWCLGKTREGFPRHPLYLPVSTELKRFSEVRLC